MPSFTLLSALIPQSQQLTQHQLNQARTQIQWNSKIVTKFVYSNEYFISGKWVQYYMSSVYLMIQNITANKNNPIYKQNENSSKLSRQFEGLRSLVQFPTCSSDFSAALPMHASFFLSITARSPPAVPCLSLASGGPNTCEFAICSRSKQRCVFNCSHLLSILLLPCVSFLWAFFL